MARVSIIPAAGAPRLYAAAERFVRPHEACCCALMERIERRDAGVYALVRGGGEDAVAGAITYTPGQLVLCCLPRSGGGVQEALAAFFAERDVFCVSGGARHADCVRRVLLGLGRQRLRNERGLLFMRYAPRGRGAGRGGMAPEGFSLCRCTAQDEAALLPLHLGYMQEEVLPAGREPNLAAERLAVAQALRSQQVLAARFGRTLAAKAQTSAHSGGCIQIGGVYTRPAFRGQGLAALLVGELARDAAARGKECVLFVSPQNGAALGAYRRAGFVENGRYTIAYFN